jgi:hypothetical protein
MLDNATKNHMEIAKLTLEFTKALLWPIIFLVIFFSLKTHILNLLHKTADLELEIKGYKIKLRFAEKLLKKTADKKLSQTNEISELNTDLLLSMNDKDFIFLSSLTEKNMLSKYYPVNDDEIYRYNSLCNENIFEKTTDNGYELTKMGEELFEVLAIP